MMKESESLWTFLPRYWPVLLFGKPDGTLIRLRCRLFGHDWSVCNESCCEGEKAWCRRCNGFIDVEVAA